MRREQHHTAYELERDLDRALVERESPMFKTGDKVTTDFDVRDRRVVRIVVDVYECRCESGFMVATQCEERDVKTPFLTADSHWFRRVEVKNSLDL